MKMFGPEVDQSKPPSATIHSRSASMPSELPTSLLGLPRSNVAQRPVPGTKAIKQWRLNAELAHNISNNMHNNCALDSNPSSQAFYSPNLSREFTSPVTYTRRASRGMTPPTGPRHQAMEKLLSAKQFNSCTNSPLANHKLVTMEKSHCTTSECPISSHVGGVRMFWHRLRAADSTTRVSHQTHESTEASAAIKHAHVDHLQQTRTGPDIISVPSENHSPTAKDTNNITKNQFFQRLRWRRSQRTGRATSASADSSPVLTSDTLHPHEPTVRRKADIANPLSACVKLVDTQITKGLNGFGLTLTEILTFIPNKLLGLRCPAGVNPENVGFYQRLLQIRAVSGCSSPAPINTYTTTANTSNHSPVRAGDILLAVEGVRLAGCSPEYAVRLLSGIPVGANVNVTLLRGLSLAPISICSREDGEESFSNTSTNHNVDSDKHRHESNFKPNLQKVTANKMQSKQGCKSQNCEIFGKNLTLSCDLSCASCSGNTFEVELLKQSDGFGFTFAKLGERFIVESVTPEISYVACNDRRSLTLLPGDQLLEIGNSRLSTLSQPQAVRLCKSVPLGKSLRFVVHRGCEKCASISQRFPQPNFSSNTSAIDEISSNQSSVADTSHVNVSVANSYTLMPFQWFCGSTGTGTGMSASHKFSKTDSAGSGHTGHGAVSSHLPDAVAGLMPFRCPLQGVGISGPCRTPDYVPASHFITTTTNAQACPVSGISPVILTPLTSLGPNGEMIDSVTVSLSPYSSLNFSKLSSELQESNLQSTTTCPMSMPDTTMVSPTNARSGGPKLSYESMQDNMLGIISVDADALPGLCNHIDVGDLTVSADGKSAAGVSHDKIMQFLRGNSETNSARSFVHIGRRGTRQAESVTEGGNSKNNGSDSTTNTRQAAKIRFRSFTTTSTAVIPEAVATQSGVKQNTHKKSDEAVLFSIHTVDSSPEANPGTDTFNVELHREENEGFGFVIVSSLNSNKASEIGRIIPGSPADKCGRLSVGNRIVAINGQLLAGLHHTEIVQLIRHSQQRLLLTVQQSSKLGNVVVEGKSVTDGRFQASQESNRSIGHEELRSEMSDEQKVAESPAGTEAREVQSVYAVTLRQSPQGFGFSIRGGIDFERIPLFVFRIAKGGPAHLDGRMQVGDEIVEINGIRTNTLTHQQAVDAIRMSGGQLSLLLSRLSSKLCETGV